MEAVPTVLALHPHIEEVYRQQVVDLEAALAVPEAQLEAIPRLRAMIARIVVHPNLQKKRGVALEVIRQMDEITIGRASCRDRVCQNVYISVVAVSLKKKKE